MNGSFTVGSSPEPGVRSKDSPALATTLFPVRVPETSEVMTIEESASLAAWRSTTLGYAVYSGLATHIVERLDITGGRVLSVGEGEGFLAAQIAAIVPEAEVIGTDLCGEVVEVARSKYRAPNLRFEAASATDLARFGSVDVVMCSFSLHHFVDVRSSLEEMVKALGPGGQLYLQDLRRDALLATYFEVLDMYVANNLTVAGLYRASINAAYTRPEVEALLAPFGGSLRVGNVTFGPRARAAFCKTAGEGSLPSSLQTIDGLWLEAVLRPGAV